MIWPMSETPVKCWQAWARVALVVAAVICLGLFAVAVNGLIARYPYLISHEKDALFYYLSTSPRSYLTNSFLVHYFLFAAITLPYLIVFLFTYVWRASKLYAAGAIAYAAVGVVANVWVHLAVTGNWYSHLSPSHLLMFFCVVGVFLIFLGGLDRLVDWRGWWMLRTSPGGAPTVPLSLLGLAYGFLAVATVVYVWWRASFPYYFPPYTSWSPVGWLNWHPSVYISMWVLAWLLRKSRLFLLGMIAWSIFATANCFIFSVFVTGNLQGYMAWRMAMCLSETRLPAQYACLAVLLAACLMLRLDRNRLPLDPGQPHAGVTVR